jgi:pimeloyl-[acyl-carrier protein] methyl ester esterase
VSAFSGTVVILPGLDGTGLLTEEFAAGDWKGLAVQVIPIPKEGAQDYPALANKIAADLPPGPLILLGESFSSPLALRIAAQERQRVTALVLAGGFCSSPLSPALSLIPVRPLFLIRPPATILRKFLAGPDAPKSLIQRLSKAIRSVSSGTLTERVRVILALQEKDCPAPEGMPTLLLQARQDAMIPWETQSRLERHFVEPTVVWIDSPHLLLATRPEACREAVLAFLNERN